MCVGGIVPQWNYRVERGRGGALLFFFFFLFILLIPPTPILELYSLCTLYPIGKKEMVGTPAVEGEGVY